MFHTNPASSGAVHKINSIIIANIDGSANADFDLIMNNAGSNTFLVKTVVVPADATLVAFERIVHSIYLRIQQLAVPLLLTTTYSLQIH